MLSDTDESRQRAHAAREALVGKTIAGRYVLRGLVGHGGMGAVYEAEHVGIGKRAAIKFVDPEFATDEKVVARFAREARAMSAIESAHIVTVFDAGTEDGRPYLVMELLRGEDLGQRLRRLSRIPLGEAMHIIAQVLKGLARAHAAGIVHRDLKPDNVFLVKHDNDPLFAKIVDFGISKIERPRDTTSPLALTGRGTVLGTPFYMSPEQAQASPDVDRRTDLYSVGAILFECLTGRPPHTGESYEQVILSICMRDAPTVKSIEPSVPDAVSAFVARALSRDRAKRFASAEAMLAALHEVAPEERARVPLDASVAVADADESAPNPLGATRLDGGSPGRASRPSYPEESGGVSAATRLGVGALPGGERSGSGSAGAGASEGAGASASAGAREGAKGARASDGGARRSSGGGKGRASKAPARRPIGVAVMTAALAALTGVGVTFGIISTLDKKTAPAPGMLISSASRPTATPSTMASEMPGETGAAVAVAPSASVADAAPSLDGAPPSTASAKPSTPSSIRSDAGTAHPVPRPSSTKPLDIQRDLP